MKFEKVYKEMVDALQPSADFKKSLFKGKEEKRMKLQKKKTIIVAAIACMLVGTTAFAASHIASYRSWSSPKDAITNYDDAMKKSEELGAKLTIPETFSNGYTFDSANTMGVEGLDENDHVMVTSTDFTTEYKKENCPEINLFINEMHEAPEENYAIDSRKIGDVVVYFNQATYKFVPTSYEWTKEDDEAIKDPHYEISWGSEEVEIESYNGVTFAKDGKYYNMFAWDCDMTADEWYQMAEEILEQ